MTTEATAPTEPSQGPRPISISTLARYSVSDLVRAFRPLIIFEGVLKGIILIVGLIGTAYIVSPLIERSGHAAVTNTDIVSFLVSPVGVAAGFLMLFGTLLASTIEHVGVMSLLALLHRRTSVSTEQALAALASIFFRLIRIKFKALVMVILISSPFAILTWLTYIAFLREHDINYYLSTRPPSFYVAVGIGGTLALGLAIILIQLLVRAIFVVPALVVTNASAESAIQTSAQLTLGSRRKIGVILAAWYAIGVLLGVVLVRGFSRSAAVVLGLSAARPNTLVPVVGILLIFQAVLLTLLSTFLVAIECILVLRLYIDRSGAIPGMEPEGELGTPEAPKGPIAAVAGITWRSVRRFWMVSGIGVLVLIGILLAGLSQRLSTRPKVLVTAHRGYSKVAPENTLAAFRKAAEAGADFVELDVQETSDGELVVIHDRDLMRVAGDPRQVAQITLAEIKKLDVGSRFSPEFAGERVPTLEESIEFARGKIGLQIELKYYAKDHGLAEKVAALVERLKFEPECEIISLDYEALLKAKARDPRLKTVAVITYALGDVGRLDVDALSVHDKLIDNRLLRSARAQGKKVYAWTVDDARQMVSLIERGVSNLVTNAPGLAVSIQRELDGLTDIERRLLTARYLLGLEPDREIGESYVGVDAPQTDSVRSPGPDAD